MQIVGELLRMIVMRIISLGVRILTGILGMIIKMMMMKESD